MKRRPETAKAAEQAPLRPKLAAGAELRNFVAVNAGRAFFRARFRKVEIKFRKAWF
jgi:hypothetical protein